MISMYKIWTVARFEMKTLFRSWFFRIFAILALGILTVLNIGLCIGNTMWAFRGIPASIPYLNVLLLNIIQAVIAVFLASDFLKRDKKLDTTEVVYMRSITNTDYVLGKTLGIFILFMALNLCVLLLAGVFNFFFADVPVRMTAYLLYPVLLSIPTLIFIFGLSFFCMVTIRNQAVTFIILLGYIALTLFFLGQRFFNLFDYMGFHIPLLYSDFTGFGDPGGILVQRGIYLFLGFAFVFATILLLKRLPQVMSTQRLAFILMCLFTAGSLALGWIHVHRVFEGRRVVRHMLALNARNGTADVSALRCGIDLVHEGNHVKARATLVVRNDQKAPLDHYVFRLNPGLEVKSVSGREPMRFERNVHMLTVHPAVPLEPGAQDSFTVEYGGAIREDALYPDIPASDKEASYSLWIYKIKKRYSFVSKHFVLLTPEAMWYPMAGSSIHPEKPESHEVVFTRYSLQVNTAPGLQVFSQGARQGSEGRFSARPEFPLPGLSLVIGRYAIRTITVDSISYALATLQNHRYFEPYFNALGDTMASLIRGQKLDYETNLGLTYPYLRLSLIEVPIQFYSYPRAYTLQQETVQPEMVFLPENGVLISGADFKQAMRFEKMRQQRSNMVSTETEVQARFFRRFVSSTLVSQETRMGSGRDMRGGVSGVTASLLPVLGTGDRYLIFPNYYSFVNALRSDRFPLFNMALEAYIGQNTQNAMFQMLRGSIGLSATDKSNLALEKYSLGEILKNPDLKEIQKEALKAKGNYLFTLLQSKVHCDDFQAFLASILEKYRFSELDLEAFNQELLERAGVDFMPDIEKWAGAASLPGFLLTDIQAFKIIQDNRERVQVKFRVYNPFPAEGLLTVSFRIGGGGPGGPGAGMAARGGPGGGMGGGMGFGAPGVEKIISIGGEQAKEVGIVLDGAPRMMTVNTMIARNLPSTLTHVFESFETNAKAEPFDGEQLLDNPLPPEMMNEIIVDNEDPGFRTEDKETLSLLKRIFGLTPKEEEKYAPLQFWRPPTKWRATAGTNFYGTYIRSACYIKAGEGDKKVSWTAMMKEAGQYDLFTYVYPMRRMGPPRREEGQGQNVQEQYHYFVHHADGVEEAVLEIKNAENGWNFLGTYYLASDSVQVELTNQSPGRVVIADAVKWVRK